MRRVIIEYMNSRRILFFLGFILFIGIGSFLLINKKNIVDKNSVPLPQETDIINLFFRLIQEHRVSEAVMMINPNIIDDEVTKQAWGVQLNAFESFKLKNIEASMSTYWTENEHIYKVTAEVKMKPEAVNAVIPNYGWENGVNIKWVNIGKIDGRWFINGIASGP